jgi:hypothetical protein
MLERLHGDGDAGWLLRTPLLPPTTRTGLSFSLSSISLSASSNTPPSDYYEDTSLSLSLSLLSLSLSASSHTPPTDYHNKDRGVMAGCHCGGAAKCWKSCACVGRHPRWIGMRVCIHCIFKF